MPLTCPACGRRLPTLYTRTCPDCGMEISDREIRIANLKPWTTAAAVFLLILPLLLLIPLAFTQERGMFGFPANDFILAPAVISMYGGPLFFTGAIALLQIGSRIHIVLRLLIAVTGGVAAGVVWFLLFVFGLYTWILFN